MNRIEKCLSFALILVFLMSIPVNAQMNKVNVILDGTGVDMETILENNRTLAPIEILSKKLDFDVEYIGNQIKIKNDKINISLNLNSNKVILKDKELELDVKPLIIGDDIYVPLRFVAENMEKEVIWDEKNNNVLIGGFNQEFSVEDTFIYFNKKYGYTLSLPLSWKEEAIIETKDGTLYVYDKKSVEKFIEDDYTNSGPVFEIRNSDYSITAGLTYSDNYVLEYSDGKYIEALFGSDFQFYPETVDSYEKIYNEALKALGSFRMINADYEFVEDNKDNYEREIKLLSNILDNHVPENIFKREEIFTYWKPILNSSFLYMRDMKNEDEISIKIEAEFDKQSNLIRYHLKNYYHELEEKQLTQENALKLANEFVNSFVDKHTELNRIPDLYPSLYEEGKHETYGDKQGRYVVVVDLVHGFIEYYGMRD